MYLELLVEVVVAEPLGGSLVRSSTLLFWGVVLLAVRASGVLLGLETSAVIFEFRFSPGPCGEPIGSTQFLHPIHLQMAEQAIFAW